MTKTYQVRPAFKDTFRPQVKHLMITIQKAKELIVKKIEDYVTQHPNLQPQDYPSMAKTLADGVKNDLRKMGKDTRYKYLVQCIVGVQCGQGVRMGTRQFWDENTDNVANVTIVKEVNGQSFFATVVAYAMYIY